MVDLLNSIFRYDGETLGQLPESTKEHHTFAGWYTTYANDEYSGLVSASTTVTGPMTLHAKWTENEMHTVTFDFNGGTLNNESSFDLLVDDGTTIDENDYPEPVYEGKDFDGWYTDEDPPEEFDPDTLITDDITLVAHWIDASYVAEVNGSYYETLADAIEAVPTGSVKTNVRILRDITQTTTISIPNNKWVELDIGNYTISGTSNLIANSGKLDIISGTIFVENNTTNTIITNSSKAILNVSGGNLINNSFVYGTTEFVVIANSGGTVNITGGTITSKGQSATINNNSGTLNVSGGEIKNSNVTKAQAIYVSGGTANISGTAYIENVSGDTELRAAVDNNGGTLNITGGEIVSKGYVAVAARKANCTTTIGINDSTINRVPVLSGKVYGLIRENGTVNVYDGLFRAEDNTTAVNGTITPITSFYDDPTTVTYDGRTYHVTYLRELEYTVNFYTEENVLYDTATIQSGTTIGSSNMPNDPTKQDYYFDGWYDENVGEITSTTTVNREINAYARWAKGLSTATITPNSMSIEKGSTDTISITGTELESYSIVSSDASVATVDSSGVVTAVEVGNATITITGNRSGYTKTISVEVTPVMVTVTFDKNDGVTAPSSVSVVKGSAMGILFPSASRTGYVFDGWYNGETKYTSSSPINQTMTLVARWKENVNTATVTTNPDPFTIMETLTGQITVTNTETSMEVENYSYSSADTSVATVDSTGLVTAIGEGNTNIVINGTESTLSRNIPITVTRYVSYQTVTFDKDDGTTPEEISVETGTNIGEDMPNDPTRAGYVFVGWFDGQTEIDENTVVNNTINAVAKWKEKVSIATIPESPLTLHLGTSRLIDVIASVSGDELESYTLLSSDTNVVEVDNHTIYGTSLGTITLTITGGLSGDHRTITVNVTDSYNVTFDPDNNDTPTVIQVTEDAQIGNNDPSTKPTKQGYVFDRWYVYDETNEVLTSTPFDPNTTVTGDIVYKAKWVSNTMFVAVDFPGGTQYYASIKEGINALTTSDPIDFRILQNINSTSGQTSVPANRNIVLIGGEFTVNCGSGASNQLIYVSSQASVRVKSGSFVCGKANLAVFETQGGGTLYVDGGLIHNTNNRGAVYNGGAVVISGGTLKSDATIRPVVQNTANTSSITMSGGEIIQTATGNVNTSGKDDGRGAIKVISNSTATITGGTITANADNSPAIYAIGGTLVIGTNENGANYDATNPVIQNANYYGVDSSVDYSVYDGIIKGKSTGNAVNNETKITGTETNSTKVTDVVDGYSVLYYTIAQTKYRIYFHAGDGTASDEYIDYNLNEQITAGSLATATNPGYTFGGWYTDDEFNNAFSPFAPQAVGTAHYYAKWTIEKYRIYFHAGDGTASDEYIDYDLNEEITASDLATATNGVYTLEGWYTDDEFNNAFVAFTPSTSGVAHYYANWTFASSLTPVNHITTSDALTDYFTSVSAWAAADAQIANNQDTDLSNDNHSTFTSNLNTIFTNYSCSYCNDAATNSPINKCDRPTTGTYCDQPQGFDTGLDDDLNVYLFVNGAKEGNVLDYITSEDGVIYNMIPGVTYYWESQNDSSIYGVVSATKNATHYRRTLKSTVRNLRDLGGMPVSYTVDGNTTTGTIKYGRMYRGAAVTGGQTSINELKKLGINREIDLREDGDGNGGQSKFDPNNSGEFYDVSLTDSLYTRFVNTSTYSTDGFKDVKITNYLINPTATTYISQPHSEAFKDLKQAMKAIMRQIVNHENVYFHCTIGTDRTGTIAYFLEGLLGVSEEDRLRDYEMTYYYGLTNRSRFHNNLSGSSINPRFYAMYKSYPTVADIETFYFTNPESDDESLLAAFRAEMIN